MLCVAKLRNALLADDTYISIAMQRIKCCNAGEGRRAWVARAMTVALVPRSDQGMTAFAEHTHELGATFARTADAQTATRTVATIKRKLASFWPPALIAFGLILTLGWNVALVWLLYKLI